MAKPEQDLEVYLVGGAVRDALLGLPVEDRDWVVVGATPEEMIRRGFKPVGKDFPVFLHPHTKEEYALARTERKTGPGYRGFVFDTSPAVTLRDDLTRRDLTINAMAQTPHGALIDHFGGKQDLEQGILRHVSPAFAEDPVRVLRVARFAARYGFVVATETMRLMRLLVDNGEVDALVPERVWAELERALGAPRPALFVEILRECGALAKVFPEIDALFGVPQPRRYHPEIDTGVHTLLAVDAAARATQDPQVRFAVLVHDVGKAFTPADELPHHLLHERRGVPLIQELCARLRVPNAYRDLALVVCRYHLQMQHLEQLKPATILTLLEALDAFRRPERVAQFALACAADTRGRSGREHEPYPQAPLLQHCFDAAQRVDAAAIAQRHGSGEDIARAIHRERVRAIRAARSAYQASK